MPTYRNKRTGTKTITGVNTAKDRVAQRRPDLYERVDNVDEPATPDGQVVEKMAAENERRKQASSKPAEQPTTEQTGTEQTDSGGQKKQTRTRSKQTEQTDTAEE